MHKIYNIKVVPRAKHNRVEKLNEDSLKIWLIAAPVDNKANFLLLEVVADYLNVKQRQISFIKGIRSRDKQIMVADY
ncbi:DUF167 domain-containing protein [Patescibacteria group bacterium]|nr:DUF167 domain-containing protein [Patescibacteria group bacterium]